MENHTDPSDKPNSDNEPKEPRPFEELMADDALTEAGLQAELEKYREALRGEYEVATTKNPDNIIELTRDFFKNNSSEAAAQVVWLMCHADSETVRLSAAKYVIDHGAVDAKVDGDPIKDLLTKLQANDPKKNKDKAENS